MTDNERQRRRSPDLALRHEEILSKIDQGWSALQIAGLLHVDRSTVHKYLKRHGLKARDVSRDHSHWSRHGRVGACEKQHEVVVRMAEAGATLDAIGRTVGTNQSAVRSYLTRHGIQRPVWRQPPSDHPMARNTSGRSNPAWRGGRVLDKHGYVLLWVPGHPEANSHGYVREHRIVMAKTLGRPLTHEEVVDHIDQNTSNNDPCNLRLFPNNAAHLKATLTGVPCPARANRRRSIRLASDTDDQRSRQEIARKPARFDRDPRHLS